MCGIAGFMVLGKEHFGEKDLKVMERTVISSIKRGTDATGVMYGTMGVGYGYCKHGVPAPMFFKNNFKMSTLLGMNYAMFHTRSGTGGKPSDNNNNHPIIGADYTILHNGIVSQMDKVKGYKYKGECDTELIVAKLDDLGLKAGLREVKGSASLIIYEHKTNKIFLWRYNNPMKIVFDNESGLVVMISDEELYYGYNSWDSFGDIWFKKKNKDLKVASTEEEMLYELTLTGINEVCEVESKGWSGGYVYAPSVQTDWDKKWDEDRAKAYDKKVNDLIPSTIYMPRATVIKMPGQIGRAEKIIGFK
jgi:predicted glutamine amidotransferase